MCNLHLWHLLLNAESAVNNQTAEAVFTLQVQTTQQMRWLLLPSTVSATSVKLADKAGVTEKLVRRHSFPHTMYNEPIFT